MQKKLKKQKKKIFKKIKEPSINRNLNSKPENNILNKNLENNNIIQNNNVSDIKEDSTKTKNKTKIKITLPEEVIKNIKSNNGKTKIKIFDEELNFYIKYTYKNKTTNNYFFQCNKRPLCKGKSKFDLKKEEFYITEKYDSNISHDQLNYEKLCELIKNNKLSEINFSIRKNQKLLIKYIIMKWKKEDNVDAKKEFIKYTKVKLILSNSKISKIKSKIFGKLRGLNLEECIKKINDPNYTLEIYTSDIKYYIKLNKNNKEIERDKKIIVFGNKQRIQLFKNPDYKEYFIDIAFKIIPKIYRPYKLMTIANLNYKENKTILICFVLLKYLDKISYKKFFNILMKILNLILLSYIQILKMHYL